MIFFGYQSRKWMALAIILLVAACGGNSGSSTTPASTTTTVSGSAVAGAVTGSVVVKDAGGTQVASGTVSNGAFTVNVPNSALAGELHFEVTGSYTDEVSGLAVTLTAANALQLRTAAGHFVAGATGNAPITPDSTVIAEMVNGGMTLTNALNTFSTAFGYAPDLTAVPFDPYGAVPAGANAIDNTAAFLAGAYSQLCSDLGLTTPTDIGELPARLAADLADGTLDGIGGGNPVVFSGGMNLQNLHAMQPLAARIVTAMANFAGSATNVAGVTAPTSGFPALAAMHDAPGTTRTVTMASGAVWDVTLDVTYASPFPARFNVARTTHTITVTDPNNANAPVDLYTAGVVVSQKPWMHMLSGMGHPSEAGTIDTANAANGVLTGDVYYRMASAMMGTPMGIWDYEVQFYEPAPTDAYTSVIFHPLVNMVMGGAILKGTGNDAYANAGVSVDTWSKMGMVAPRAYNVWLNSIAANAGGGHDLTVFVATQNMAMGTGMSFPAVYPGVMLNKATMGMITLAGVTVEASPDGGATWTPLTSNGDGSYSAVGMAGLTTAATANIDIRLKVDIGGGLIERLTAAGAWPRLTFTAP